MSSSRRRALTRRGKRRLQRGAIFVESVVVIAFLSLMFAAALFFHQLYAKKIETIYRARNSAWSNAIPGCRGGALAAIGPAALVGNLMSGNAGSLPSQKNPGILQIGAGKIEPQSDRVTAAAVLGGKEYTFSTSTRFVCNEMPQVHSDLASFVGYFRNLFIP